ncbi:Crp/Fnr family transcriptional regulator [Segetibacter koreensis]|uniref:Crp/Fnr family transcriptional regulator n=1 Tax=Segetibacter koreensis TaxID=398037 RepID=UPI0003805036|nr:cyclic nucleotide-binding domain-containing protein [Segetibacter koreensis]
MLLIEKVLVLKSCEIFQNTPESDLIELAAILEEIYLEEGKLVFSKGDTGNCMYFIYSGSVKIHDGEHVLALLGENEIVGELSILDSETRSASATIAEESILLKLEQEPFYEIIMNNADILKGILKTLCRRLRIINKKSTTMANTNPLI